MNKKKTCYDTHVESLQWPESLTKRSPCKFAQWLFECKAIRSTAATFAEFSMVAVRIQGRNEMGGFLGIDSVAAAFNPPGLVLTEDLDLV
jgi:hypothetical protein